MGEEKLLEDRRWIGILENQAEQDAFAALSMLVGQEEDLTVMSIVKAMAKHNVHLV